MPDAPDASAAPAADATASRPPRPPRVVIAGAGLAGALLAVMLGRRGWPVTLYERRPDPRAAGFVGGRSINLALSVRGLTALERVGLAERVRADALPMSGRLMHATDGTTTYQPYSRLEDRAINSVSRGGLNLALLEAADALPSVTIEFDRRVAEADLEAGRIHLEDGAGTPRGEATGDLIVGADGAFSAIRAAMQRTQRFDYSQSWLPHGYKELEIPPTAAGDFALDPHALHIWPRGGSMMIALPNRDRTFTCTLFWPLEGEHSFGHLPAATASDAEITAFFERWYGDAVPLMPTLVRDYRANPTSSLVTIRCAPWHHEPETPGAGPRFVLLGDAAHAIVPFYGQGMNAAFEDCRVLDELIDEMPETQRGDFSRLLPEFSRRRKPAADAIAAPALANFVEMRDKVGSRAFLWRKKIEKLLNRLFPKAYVPLYDLVSFSNVPYHEARARARRQDRAAAQVAAALAIVLVAVAALAIAGLA